MTPATIIGSRIRAARKARGLTQIELGEVVGIAQPQVSALERGATRNPKADTLRALAEALDVSADYLLGLEGDR